jgi:transcriptional antiterminator NusG
MSTKWYLLKVLSGKEKQLTEQLNQQILLGKIKNVERFVCPTEKEYVKVKNKKILRDKIIYNGYVYFETKNKLNEDELKDFSNIPNVISMFGDKLPILMNDADVRKIIKDEALQEHNENKIMRFLVGDTVLVKEGPFQTFDGKITKINDEKIEVEIKIFGRSTFVAMNLEQIEKIK